MDYFKAVMLTLGVVGSLCLVVGVSTALMESSIKRDCDGLGAVRLGSGVYECHPRVAPKEVQ